MKMNINVSVSIERKMDPLFERRELTGKVHIESRFLQKNIQSSLLIKLKQNFEGKCLSEGYINSNSITVLDYSLGRTNSIKGGVDYTVTFQADICLPHPGQVFRAPVSLKSKIGIHAELSPLEILIPRDIHIGNEEFENVQLDQDIEFEVVGCHFKQQDKTIVVVGRLRTAIKPGALPALLTAEQPETEVRVANVPQSVEGEEKMVTVKKSEPEPSKTRRLKRKGGVSTNEFPSFQEGVVEGST